MTSVQRPLPELRPELRLVRGATTVNGEPSWLIHDPVQNRFIQIDAVAYHVLSQWRSDLTAGQLAAAVVASGRIQIDTAAVEALVRFLDHSRLTVASVHEGWRNFEAERQRARRRPFAWLAHNYLFFRIPLFRPQRFLERTLPVANMLASRGVGMVIVLLGLVGLYLTARQWDEFIATLPDMFTLEGVTLMGLTLLLVKSAHELGHAYTAVRYGCRVPTMGAAFMLMAPLLYTDVTDAWRLTDRRQRLRVDSAGVRVEIAIAAVALFMWAFLPDGTLRGLAFNLCTLSIASSLFINLNPLMRFDGYYLLSELLGVENLQARAFELGRWRLRELLFGLGAPCPEQLPAQRLAVLTFYAWATWIYRLFLFVGIALIVYHFFFKALGIALFIFEIAVFVARPVWSEVRVWWKSRERIMKTRRAMVTGAVIASLVLLAVVPWSTRVAVPGVVEMEKLQQVFPIRSGIIDVVHVRPQQAVTVGDPLVTLRSPDIEQELALAQTKLELAQLKFARRGADASDKEASLVLENQIRSLQTQIAGLRKQLGELVLTAPFDGHVVELNPELHAGRWIGPKEMVATVGEATVQLVKGYVPEADLRRIAIGATGHFVPDGTQRAMLDIAVTDIAVGSSAHLDLQDVASVHAGKVPAINDEKGRLVPTSAQFLVKMQAASASPELELSVRGVALIDGEAESLMARAWRQVLKVLVRESGA